MNALLMLLPTDKIAMAVRDIEPGETLALPDGGEVIARARVPFGFKVAVRDIAEGEKVFKYGVPIGTATATIAAGELVHLHNLKSDYIATRRERT